MQEYLKAYTLKELGHEDTYATGTHRTDASRTHMQEYLKAYTLVA